MRLFLASIIPFLFFVVTPCCNISPKLYAQEASKLEKAQWLYQHENFEEALVLFKELRAESPQSGEIAYYLGLTYKRLQDYLAAKPFLEAAVESQPRIDNALLELIDLLYQCDQVEEAKKWIAVAEKDFVTPGQTAFFKGLVILKQGDDPAAALKAFEDAQNLDPSLAQAVKYQLALANMQLKNFKAAKNIFKEIIIKDPTADLAGFANEYVDALTRTEEAAQPFHGRLGYETQYDDNVVSQPNDQALSPNVSEDSDWKHAFTAQADYTLKPADFFNLKAGYSFYGVKNFRIGFYDMMSYDLSLQPALYFKKVAVAFPLHYNYLTVNDRAYLDTTGLSGLVNYMFTKRQMLQGQLQYNIQDFRWSPTSHDEKKSSLQYIGSLGWYYFFAKNNQGFINLRYSINYDDAAGNNWKYLGNRFTLTTVVPLVEKLKWNFVFDYSNQDFSKKNTSYDKGRRDDVFTVNNLLAYEFVKNTELQMEHTYVYDSSSIGIYKYEKHVYGMGVQYRF